MWTVWKSTEVHWRSCCRLDSVTAVDAKEVKVKLHITYSSLAAPLKLDFQIVSRQVYAHLSHLHAATSGRNHQPLNGTQGC